MSQFQGYTHLLLNNEELMHAQSMAALIEKLIYTEGARRIVLDLNEIDALSSLQIGTLVALHMICYENVVVMTLANVNERNKNVLKLVGLDKIMAIHQGQAVAQASFGPLEDLEQDTP